VGKDSREFGAPTGDPAGITQEGTQGAPLGTPPASGARPLAARVGEVSS